MTSVPPLVEVFVVGLLVSRFKPRYGQVIALFTRAVIALIFLLPYTVMVNAHHGAAA
jgi:hypothetical protein